MAIISGRQTVFPAEASLVDQSLTVMFTGVLHDGQPYLQSTQAGLCINFKM